jgi:spermidine synthase
MTPSALGLRCLYGLIFLSGSSSLIYQVVWQRYLSILLGAQARATAVVLAIFMGGIGLGYAAFGRWSRHKP